MTWWHIRKQDSADCERADTMREALERLDEIHERARRVADRLERDDFAEQVAALFRGERPS